MGSKFNREISERVVVIAARRDLACGQASGIPQGGAKNGGEYAETKRRMRVAAYCRVSTASDAQETSYESQCRHYTDFIKDNTEWEFAGIYADEGITGTSASKRPEFMRLMSDCRKRRIDMVITKSISRFARNTLDCLKYIRELKALGIAIFFEKENINTLDAKGEVLVTIMASLAQEESQSISQNVRTGIQYRMQQGIGRLNTSIFLGFARGDQAGEWVIVPEEAEIVRQIFRDYLDGYSPGRIAASLMRDGVPSPAGKESWYASTVKSILTNEKYTGDLLMQKYYTEDFLTQRVLKNNGALPQYYVKNHHKPIIPRAVFERVQNEVKRRRSLMNEPRRLRLTSGDALKGRIICGLCGRSLKRCLTESGDIWQCKRRAASSVIDCDCRIVFEEEIKVALTQAFTLLPEYADEMHSMLQRTRDQISQYRSGDLRPDTEPFIVEELLDKEMRIISLMQISGCADTSPVACCREGISHTDNPDASPGACYTEQDFMMRTGVVLEYENGEHSADDAMVIRFVDKIIIEEYSMKVIFRAGITIEIPE